MSEIIKIILAVVTALTTAVITIVSTLPGSKKKDKIIKTAKILQKLPEIITAIEQSCTVPGQGAIKKLLALNQVQIECQKQKINYNEEEWSAEIEKILETPQKKEKL